MEIETIKETITKNYVHGAFNETNIDAFNKIMHSEFSIINTQENGSFYLFTKKMWEKVLIERLANKNFDYSTIAFTPNYKKITVTKNKASVNMELVLNGKLVYTEFWLMIKIDGQWKFVSKIFHTH